MNVILTVVAVIGATVAIKGLNTWQRQLKGKSEYDLTKSLLTSLFRFRDAINGMRTPTMWASEVPKPPEDEAETMSFDQIRFYGTSNVYQARWDKIQQERTNLYGDLLEAEALWGEELVDLFKILFDLQHELLVCSLHHIELVNPDTTPAKKEAIYKMDKKRRNVLYDDLSEEGDDFKKEFQAGIKRIEKLLKPKLAD